MTPLARLLIRRIAADGPITIADYMAKCLLHPQHGYYATRDPFGAAGDFTTAPEISQMFGELLGLALAQCWVDQGRPAPVTLAEIGPGRGTLMRDALRATARVPGFHAAASVHLVEASPRLRAHQAQVLAGHAAQWHATVASLPPEPLYLIANEFFDALPVRQFIRAGPGWRERVVGLAAGALAFGLTGAAPCPTLASRLRDTGEGEVVEVCPPAAPVIAEIAARISTAGAALIIDYGGWPSRGGTLQALRAHRPCDPLAHPGESDLTAHVDFAALAAAAPGLARSLTPQGVFLERLGITARAQVLARSLQGDAHVSHIAAHRRLTHPAEMGNLFQVLALYPRGAAAPPGAAA